MSSQVYFSLEYIISVLLALTTSYFIGKNAPAISPIITYAILPLFVAYISLQVINTSFPFINKSGSKIYSYVSNKTLDEVNNMGYVQIFPPLLAVAVLMIVLLFTGNLG
jgi:hypothetical protein